MEMQSHFAPVMALALLQVFFCFKVFSSVAVSASCRCPLNSSHYNTLATPNLNLSFMEIEASDVICDNHFTHENYGLVYWNEEEFQQVSLNGTLKVAVSFVNTESLHTARMSNGTFRAINGVCSIPYSYILNLQQIFKFQIEFVPSQGWMEEGQNDTITGVGYQIVSGEADIGIDISRPVIYRARHLQFLHPVRQDKVTIVFRQPNVPLYRNILLRPFKDGLWKGAVAAWITLFLSIAFIARKRLLPMVIMDFHNFFLPVTALLLARSTNMNGLLLQRENVGRSVFIVILVSSWFGLMMYSIYAAFIVSTLRKMEYPVKNFQDLIDSNYELVAQSSLPDFATIYVADEEEEYYTKLATSHFQTVEISLARIFQEGEENGLDIKSPVGADDQDQGGYGGFGWFVLKTDFNYLALQHGYSSRQICQVHNLDPVKRAQQTRVLSMFIQQGNKSLKEHFNRKILDILGKGLGSREMHRFETEFQPNCRWRKKRKVELQKIRIYDVYAAYYVLACGGAIALAVALLEGCWKREVDRHLMYGDE